VGYRDYSCLDISIASGIARVTIDHPPINLLDLPLISELDRLGRELSDDDGVRVVVFDSANDDFFIAHADIELLQQLPTDQTERPRELGLFHLMVERFRTMPKATIGKIAGIARGGGSEFLLSLDMRFADRDRAVLAQPEVAVGILPGGSGTQRLPRLIGRGRALEVILGCDDLDADLAERWGYVNRALPSAELDAFVERLARRIASFPAEAIRLAKQAVDAADRSIVDGLLDEAHCFNLTLGSPDAQRRMKRFLELGGQTAEVERGKLADLVTLLDDQD